MTTEASPSPYTTTLGFRLRWLLPALAIIALLAGLRAWSADTTMQPTGAAVRSVLLTDATAPLVKGPNVRAESGIFVTRASTWTAYWSYYCLIPGVVNRWHVKLWLVGVHGSQTTVRRLLYSADSSSGPVSYTEFLREPGPGSFRFIVDTTPHCVWSVRAPPVTNRSADSFSQLTGGTE